MDPAYEFDAPQFFDFRRTSLGNSEASKWFEQGASRVQACAAEFREGTSGKAHSYRMLDPCNQLQTIHLPCGRTRMLPTREHLPRPLVSPALLHSSSSPRRQRRPTS